MYSNKKFVKSAPQSPKKKLRIPKPNGKVKSAPISPVAPNPPVVS